LQNLFLHHYTYEPANSLVQRYRYANPSRERIKKLTGIADNRTLDNLFDSLISRDYLIREKGMGTNSRYYIKAGDFTPNPGGNITPQKENKRKEKDIYKDLRLKELN
jgi:hypothetical protein